MNNFEWHITIKDRIKEELISSETKIAEYTKAKYKCNKQSDRHFFFDNLIDNQEDISKILRRLLA